MFEGVMQYAIGLAFVSCILNLVFCLSESRRPAAERSGVPLFNLWVSVGVVILFCAILFAFKGR